MVATQIPEEAVVALDAGTCCLMTGEALEFSKGRKMLTPLDHGSLGFALPASIGAKLAAPDRPVISFSGDGGFGYVVNELGTAVELRLDLLAIVLANGSWGAEKAYQVDFYDGRVIGRRSLPSYPMSPLPRRQGVHVGTGLKPGYRQTRADGSAWWWHRSPWIQCAPASGSSVQAQGEVARVKPLSRRMRPREASDSRHRSTRQPTFLGTIGTPVRRNTGFVASRALGARIYTLMDGNGSTT